MNKVVVIPLETLDAHSVAFRWLDGYVVSSYSYFGRLVLDAFFVSNEQRPTSEDLVKAFFNHVQGNSHHPTPKDGFPDVIMEHIDAAASKALEAVALTKRQVEFEWGPVPTSIHYDLLPSSSYDLIFSYVPANPTCTYPQQFATG